MPPPSPDDLGDRAGLRQHRHMRAFENEGLRAHSLRQIALDSRGDGLVLRRDDVPRTLGTPATVAILSPKHFPAIGPWVA